MKLYELADQFSELQAMLEGADGDMAQAITDTIEGVQMELDAKMENCVILLRSMAEDGAAVDAEIKRLQAIKKRNASSEDGLKAYMVMCLQRAGVKKAGGLLHGVTLVAGRDRVVVDDVDSLPDDMVTVQTTVTPDKRAIGDRIKAGEEVAGARIEKGEPSLRVN